MGATLTAWGRRVDELLADGQWHPVEEVLQAAMPLVPPGVAYRTGERERAKRRGHGTAPLQRQLNDTATAVATGRRTVVRKLISDKVRSGAAERHGQRVRRVRRRSS